ncbi:tyrosine-type recombinase/integrase [Curtobacterium sp. PhB146]|uniref:tyrosine-type recombinase/integrase n=1 Tax=Curtobacterium sp. PhB146 TaxID=2485187 RepID=UPI0010ECCD83|nr:tyrosine-type recombinase/integrase [Curtobacterium sp. PhB146]TCU48355.1 site-specific recombinase XerD [Curtobacterium sp. PhB146]
MSVSRSIPQLWSIAIVAFLAAQRAAGLPHTTCYTRRQHLEHLARRIGAASPWEVDPGQLVTWAGSQTWSRETRRGRRTTFRAFWLWAIENGHTSINPAAKLPRVKPVPPTPHPTPDTVLQRAMRRADDREQLMMRLASDCGMRRAEIAVAHSDDVFEDMLGWSIVVHGKGGKQRTVPLTRGLAAVLRSQPDGYLFPGDEDGHLSPRWVGKLVNRLLDGDWTVHSLRHRFASRAHRVNRDLAVVQDLLGHASPATTRIYVATDDAERRRTIEAIVS